MAWSIAGTLCAPLLLGVTIAAGGAQEAGPTSFRDATATNLPAAEERHVLASAAADVDDDGDLDLVIGVENGRNRIYENDGTGKFTDRPDAFTDIAADTEHVAVEDFDQDGALDVVFVAEDDQRHEYYRGLGDGGFEDVSDRLPAASEGNALAVGDVDGDEWADLVVGNTSAGGEDRDPQNLLWLGNPDRPGTFIDGTADRLPSLDDQTQGLDLVDMDGDGDLDLLVANEVPPNRLLLNDGSGRFSVAEGALDLVTPLQTREVYGADFTGDGVKDILFFNLTSNAGQWEKDPQTRLLVGDGNGRFTDETAERLPYNTYSVWAGAPLDIDGDGTLDFLAGPIQVPGFVPLRIRAFRNGGDGSFTDVTEGTIPDGASGRGWGFTVADFDGDGRDDVFVGGWRTQARLLLTSAAD